MYVCMCMYMYIYHHHHHHHHMCVCIYVCMYVCMYACVYVCVCVCVCVSVITHVETKRYSQLVELLKGLGFRVLRFKAQELGVIGFWVYGLVETTRYSQHEVEHVKCVVKCVVKCMLSHTHNIRESILMHSLSNLRDLV
jgi:hypothetical protein